MEDLIQAVNALGIGASIDDIHSACLAKGWDEDSIFLAINAGQNLYDAIVKQEEDIKKRPNPFGRK
jgi:hypothetical protein